VDPCTFSYDFFFRFVFDLTFFGFKPQRFPVLSFFVSSLFPTRASVSSLLVLNPSRAFRSRHGDPESAFLPGPRRVLLVLEGPTFSRVPHPLLLPAFNDPLMVYSLVGGFIIVLHTAIFLLLLRRPPGTFFFSCIFLRGIV